jgi:hypothetical protein
MTDHDVIIRRLVDEEERIYQMVTIRYGRMRRRRQRVWLMLGIVFTVLSVICFCIGVFL